MINDVDREDRRIQRILDQQLGSEDDGAFLEPIGYINWSAQIVREGEKHYYQVWSTKQYEITARDRFVCEREAFAQARAACERQHAAYYRVVKSTHYYSRTPPMIETLYYPKEPNPKRFTPGGITDVARTLKENLR